MKLLLLILLAALTGCQSKVQQNAGQFLSVVAKMNVSANDVTQTTIGPFYNHTESVTAVTHSPGKFGVAKLDVEFNIPVPVLGIPLFHWSLVAGAINGDTPSDASTLSSIQAVSTALIPPKS